MVKPNRSYKPKSWVSGVKIQLGGNSDGYPSGGIPVRMSTGGRAGYKYGGGADYINTHKPKKRGNPAIITNKKITKKGK